MAKPHINKKVNSQSCAKHFFQHKLLLNHKLKKDSSYTLPNAVQTKLALSEIYTKEKTKWLDSYDASCPKPYKDTKDIGYVYIGSGLLTSEIISQKALVLFCSAEGHSKDEPCHAYRGPKSSNTKISNNEMIELLQKALKDKEAKKVSYTEESINIIKAELKKRQSH